MGAKGGPNLGPPLILSLGYSPLGGLVLSLSVLEVFKGSGWERGFPRATSHRAPTS